MHAGTKADVFVTIYGENDDSGERKLQKSEKHLDKFERNQVRTLLQIIEIDRINLASHFWSFYFVIIFRRMYSPSSVSLWELYQNSRYATTTAE